MTRTKKWSTLRDALDSQPGVAEQLEEAQREFDGERREYTLGELRRSLGITQAALAELIGRSQSAVSQMESGHFEISVNVLRGLVEQLGGELKLVAEMPNGPVEINL